MLRVPLYIAHKPRTCHFEGAWRLRNLLKNSFGHPQGMPLRIGSLFSVLCSLYSILKTRTCHSIFALSLTRFAFRNPNGITYGYATFDLLLQNLSITKRCFVISTIGEISSKLALHSLTRNLSVFSFPFSVFSFQFLSLP